MKKYKIVVTDDRYENYKEENEVLSEIGVEVEIHPFVVVSGSNGTVYGSVHHLLRDALRPLMKTRGNV